MGRSWAYILMAVATLAGAVALLWPSPRVPVIEEIAMPAQAQRVEGQARGPKAAQRPAPAQGKAPRAQVAAEPAKRIAPVDTTTKRYEPALNDNGLNPRGFLGGPSKAAPKKGPTGAWRMPGTPGANNGPPGAPPARKPPEAP